MPSIPAVGDRPGPGNDDDAGLVGGAGLQRDQRVVDHEHPGLEADPLHDAGDDTPVFDPIDAGDAETDRRRHDVEIADRFLHDLVEHLLDFELTGGLQVGAPAARLGQNITPIVGELTHSLRAARVDTEHVHQSRVPVIAHQKRIAR